MIAHFLQNFELLLLLNFLVSIGDCFHPSFLIFQNILCDFIHQFRHLGNCLTQWMLLDYISADLAIYVQFCAVTGEQGEEVVKNVVC